MDRSPTSQLEGIIIPNVEKAQDDPSTPVRNRTPSHTPASLSQLLGARVEISPNLSRDNSYMTGNENLVRRPPNTDGTSLPDHLYTRGLLAGKHSDIAILAFNQRYNLHRIILDRAPYFQKAFAEPWVESHAREINLHPQAIDSSITQNAFDLALRRLYGCGISDEEDIEAVGLFATGCWLEMQEIIDSAIESILRRLAPENLGSIIRLVVTNYYGRNGDRILQSAKAMLCRDGWDMPLKCWDAIPAITVKDIISGDGFFVTGEWERWNHARKLLDRRLKLFALEFGLGNKKQTAPVNMLQWLPRFNSTATIPQSRPESSLSVTEEDKWFSLYTHPEVEPFCQLLDTGIHYVHLEFEYLQYIRQSRDVFGLPVVPEPVIMNAIYMQLELRQKVVNAKDLDLELGITTAISANAIINDDDDSDSDKLIELTDKGKKVERQSDGHVLASLEEEVSEQPKYYIPSADCNIVVGGGGITTPRVAPQSSKNSKDIDGSPGDEADTTGTVGAADLGDPPVNQHRPKSVAYSQIPPFRFAASFPSPRLIKEKKRVYSRTVFYAGSLWNIYIQKMRSQRSFQLGVYLHRVRERDFIDDLSVKQPTSVDERIGLLEREMLLSGEQRAHGGRGSRSRTSTLAHRSSIARTGDTRGGTESSLSRQSTLSTTSTLFPRRSHFGNTPSALQTFVSFDTDSSDSDESTLHEIAESSMDDTENFGDDPLRIQPFSPPQTPALPPYTDSRPTIKTYFKIFSHSKTGRSFSVYESAPDQFDFSQSWGSVSPVTYCGLPRS